MKRYFLFTLSFIILALTLVSCKDEVFPVDRVTFPSEGGSKDIVRTFYNNHIFTEEGVTEIRMEHPEKEYNTITLDWLTIGWKDNSSVFTITAKENTTGKRRKLYIFGMCCGQASSIPVIQEK